MKDEQPITFAIVDYGLGNLFSIKHACAQVGADGIITSSGEEMLDADAIILPGVGAFGDAMEAIRRLKLDGPLKEAADSGRPVIGICLGMQLLMSRSYEFGTHDGLDMIKGEVLRFDEPLDSMGRRLKVPQVGWNSIFPDGQGCWAESCAHDPSESHWQNTPLAGLNPGECMYFCHSFYVSPAEANVVLSISNYGGVEFCSSLQQDNIFAFQFHPERSGRAGLRIYRNLLPAVKGMSRKRQGVR